jgi:DNA-binding transcriptional LysR family regulator
MIVPVPKASARLTTQYLPILVSLTTFIAALDLAEIEHTFVPSAIMWSHGQGNRLPETAWGMLNIPTELLRTLVSVVDHRSFTKAAQSLGVTQPAVSAQIKRLQFLLGYELLDKSAPGVSLTSRGEMLVTHARRMLSINDQIAQLSGRLPTAQTLRVAIPGDFAGVKIPATLAQFRKRWPDIRFTVSATSFENMLRGLRQGDVDLAVAIANSKPSIEAHHLWIDQAVWVRSESTQLDPNAPVPLVSFGEDCSCRYTAVNALHRVGRDCDFVFTSRSIASLEAAVVAGLGIMVLPRGRVAQTSLSIWEDAPLPELPQLYCGIYLRQGGNREALQELADEIAAVLRPQLHVKTGGAATVPDLAPARASGSGH